MENAVTALTLAQMQKTPRAELASIAQHAQNRLYGAAASLMVHAMDAHALGDVAARTAYVTRAKAAYAKFEAGEAAQVADAAARIEALRKAGIKPSCDTKGVFYGNEFHTYTTARKRDEVSLSDR